MLKILQWICPRKSTCKIKNVNQKKKEEIYVKPEIVHNHASITIYVYLHSEKNPCKKIWKKYESEIEKCRVSIFRNIHQTFAKFDTYTHLSLVTSHNGALLMISFHLARYPVDSCGELHRGCRPPGPSRWRIQTAAKLAPRENVRREAPVPAPADKFSRKKTLMPQRTENRGRTHPRTSEGGAGESGASAKQTHVRASARTHTHRPRYPNENNTPFVLFNREFIFQKISLPRIVFPKDYSQRPRLFFHS